MDSERIFLARLLCILSAVSTSSGCRKTLNDCLGPSECSPSQVCVMGQCQPGAGLDLGPSDSGVDVGVDLGPDLGDLGIDTGVDLGIDTGVDSGIDAGVDLGPDAGPLDVGDQGIFVNSAAVRLNTVSDYVRVDHDASLDAQEFTMMLFVRDFHQFCSWVHRWDFNDRVWWLGVFTPYFWTMGISTNVVDDEAPARESLTSFVDPADRNRWFHLAATYQTAALAEDRVHLYLDGNLIGTSSVAGAIPKMPTNGMSGLDFGNCTDPLEVDEAMFFNRALSASEISQVQQALTGGPLSEILGVPNLVSWWRFDNDLNDSVGSNHGAPMGQVNYVTPP